MRCIGSCGPDTEIDQLHKTKLDMIFNGLGCCPSTLSRSRETTTSSVYIVCIMEYITGAVYVHKQYNSIFRSARFAPCAR